MGFLMPPEFDWFYYSAWLSDWNASTVSLLSPTVFSKLLRFKEFPLLLHSQAISCLSSESICTFQMLTYYPEKIYNLSIPNPLKLLSQLQSEYPLYWYLLTFILYSSCLNIHFNLYSFLIKIEKKYWILFFYPTIFLPKLYSNHSRLL